MNTEPLSGAAWWAPALAFTASFAGNWMLARSRFSRLVLDRPNERSLHSTPVPRSGGLGIATGVIVAWLVVKPAIPAPVWAAAAMLLAISFIEDIRGIAIGWRFAAHLVAAMSCVAALLAASSGALVLLAAVLAVAWMTNLYNFMDGADGLAGGMTVFGFGVYGAGAWLAGDGEFALTSFSISAAALAFLFFNFPPARVFLGDAGSVPIGFFAAALGIAGWQRGIWPLWFPLLVFSPFILDASVTLAKRLLRGEKVWQAHRSHYYQRLIQAGWGHRKTALAEYGLMAACAVAALASLGLAPQGQIALLAAAALAYGALLTGVEVFLAKRGAR